MRRKHSEIRDEHEIQRILSSCRIGRMATNGMDGFPYITPVNFVSLEGKLYFHSAPEGEKLDNIKRNPKVCFEVDVPLAYLDMALDPGRPVCRLHQFYHCIIVRGKASIIPDGPLKTAALNALVAKHEPNVTFEPVTESGSAYRACVVVEIEPMSVSAKSDLAQNKPEASRQAIAAYLLRRDLPGDRETVQAMEIRLEPEKRQTALASDPD